jgi:hypothetical protein
MSRYEQVRGKRNGHVHNMQEWKGTRGRSYSSRPKNAGLLICPSTLH